MVNVERTDKELVSENDFAIEFTNVFTSIQVTLQNLFRVVKIMWAIRSKQGHD
jgi:uncharacterized protein YqgV (UPF0045/DUF77 family)